MKFRPCIDLHNGVVKQIVGSTLSDTETPSSASTESRRVLVENFVASKPAAEYAAMYRSDGLTGGHVIMLGPNNEEAAFSALREYPMGLQIGGDVRATSLACISCNSLSDHRRHNIGKCKNVSRSRCGTSNCNIIRVSRRENTVRSARGAYGPRRQGQTRLRPKLQEKDRCCGRTILRRYQQMDQIHGFSTHVRNSYAMF